MGGGQGGQYCSPSGHWQCVKSVCVVTTGVGCYWHLVVRSCCGQEAGGGEKGDLPIAGEWLSQDMHSGQAEP